MLALPREHASAHMFAGHALDDEEALRLARPNLPVFDPPPTREGGGWSATMPTTATATHANAVLTLAAPSKPRCIGVYGFAWSYSGGAITGARLTIADGTTVIFDEDLTLVIGSNVIYFPDPFVASPGNNIVATLYDGGSGIVGKLSAISPFYCSGSPVESVDQLNFNNPFNAGLLPALGLG
jgi:hypothetical protein